MIKTYFLSLVSFLILDFLWLAVIARSFYQKYLGYLMADKVSWWPVMIFYPLYVLALTILVIEPAIKNDYSWMRLVLTAGLFGLAAYGAYDLTNQATIRNWPIIVTIVDLLWGMSVAIVIASIVFYFSK